MSSVHQSGTFPLGLDTVKRLGYGAMRLAGPGAFGPPRDPEAARAVLRAAVAGGVNHIDTSDYYGPHITNQLIREAYLRTVSRFPSNQELARARNHIAQADTMLAGMRDVLWALLNTKEFVLNH